jgi:hypothetical protein
MNGRTRLLLLLALPHCVVCKPCSCLHYSWADIFALRSQS